MSGRQIGMYQTRNDSIDHYTLLMKLHDHRSDRIITGYVWQFLNRCVEWGGLYQDIKRGIPRGSSLSQLLGAFYLMELDKKMEKTLIGRTERGFDFLGYHFEPEGLSVAGKTIERFKERIARLYEQGADSVRIGQYVRKWGRLVHSIHLTVIK